MDNIKKYLNEFKENKFIEERIDWLTERYNFFQNFFKKENLKKMEWEDIQKLGSNINAFSNGMARAKALGKPNHEIQKYRDSFIYLLYGNEEIEKRLKNFLIGDYKLANFGTSSCSEIFGWAFPDKYVFYNERDEDAIKILNIQIPIQRGDDFITKFFKYNQSIKPIIEEYITTVGRQTNFPINLELDQFFSFISEKNNKKNNSNNVKLKIDEENNTYAEYPKNLILYGPPGTGKTYSTNEIRNKLLKNQISENKNILYFSEFITFHQSYSYEEFIEGIRPSLEDGQLNYSIKDGVFKAFCKKAKQDPNNKYLFIIDEINRGNISKIFGELITLIEEDKREILSVKLPYSGELFAVPKNVYILGTMNTSDRSIALLDIALRRRFDFEELMPNYTLLNKDIKEINLGILLEKINSGIKSKIDKDHQIGHSYFMTIDNEIDLLNTWNKKIIPLLSEYFYSDYENLEHILGNKFIIKTEDGYDIKNYKEDELILFFEALKDIIK